MMEGYHGIHYHFQDMGEPTPSSSGTTTARSNRLSTGTASEPDTSFDSGFLSPTKTGNFTAISVNARGTSLALHSPSKMVGPSVIGELSGRPAWAEELPLVPGINDEWDKNFIDNFQENLFGFDASDLSNVVDGILRSPFKSPQSSPFKSPRQSRNAAVSLGLSPFKSSTSNVMLSGLRRSPLRFGGSPFKSPFSSPSPGKSGMSPYTRSSPLTRQRRLILQSPAHKLTAASVTSDQYSDLPEFLTDIKEDIEDNLGVVPFQRTNSFGFVPQEESSSASFSESFSALGSFTDEGQPFSHSDLLEIKQENGLTQIRSKKSGNRDSPGKLFTTPIGGSSTPGKGSITKHCQAIAKLHSKDALRLVRARFKEILDRATQDAILKEKTAKKKPAARRPLYSEVACASSKPVPSGSSFEPAQKGGKRRLEIRPKPEPNWPKAEPVLIAPKKRKR